MSHLTNSERIRTSIKWQRALMILIDPPLRRINYIDPLARLSDLLPVFSSVQTNLS